jgi:hypothetical protein
LDALLQGQVDQPSNDSLSGQKSAAPVSNGSERHDSTTAAPRSTYSLPAPSGGVPTKNSGTSSAYSSDQSQFRTATQSCQAGPLISAGDTLMLRATATLAGKPVVVFVFARDGNHFVVIRDRNCRLVHAETLP